jgi:hypothetical protein
MRSEAYGKFAESSKDRDRFTTKRRVSAVEEIG